MRDFASCFSDHAVKVADSSCSGGAKSSIIATATATATAAAALDSSSLPTAITTLYRALLSTRRDLHLKVTWTRTHVGHTLSLGVDDDPFTHNWSPSSINSQLLRKKKGNQSYISGRSVVGLHWDYSAAKFGSGPEPVSNLYAIVIVDAEFALLIGDLCEDHIKRFQGMITVAEFWLLSRREQVFGPAVYSTKARFTDEGKEHDIVIRCKEERSESGEPELLVIVDRKRVVQVRRLRWNFRGNHTIFFDGSPVDMMWDVSDWLFSSPPGCAFFMFRMRGALESRLWFEEEMLQRERGTTEFSLLIQAFKNS